MPSMRRDVLEQRNANMRLQVKRGSGLRCYLGGGKVASSNPWYVLELPPKKPPTIPTLNELYIHSAIFNKRLIPVGGLVRGRCGSGAHPGKLLMKSSERTWTPQWRSIFILQWNSEIMVFILNLFHQHVGLFSLWLMVSYMSHNAIRLPADGAMNEKYSLLNL